MSEAVGMAAALVTASCRRNNPPPICHSEKYVRKGLKAAILNWILYKMSSRRQQSEALPVACIKTYVDLLLPEFPVVQIISHTYTDISKKSW